MQQAALYLVDDDQSVRESLSFLLETMDYQCQAFASGSEFLDYLEQNDAYSQQACVILDSRMPEMTGQEVHQKLMNKGSALGVVFLTGHGDVPMAVEALQAGAVDFLQKPVQTDKLTAAIDKAWQYSLAQTSMLDVTLAYQSLTPREKDILEHVVQGKRNQQIADELCVAVRTIEVHKAKLMKKFDVKTAAELAIKYAKIA